MARAPPPPRRLPARLLCWGVGKGPWALCSHQLCGPPLCSQFFTSSSGDYVPTEKGLLGDQPPRPVTTCVGCTVYGRWDPRWGILLAPWWE